MEKTILKVKHADGRQETVCPKCDVVFEWVEHGSYPDQVDVYQCPCCGMEDVPLVEEREYLPTFTSTEPFAYRCPDCFGFGKEINWQDNFDYSATIYSCKECGTSWRVIC